MPHDKTRERESRRARIEAGLCRDCGRPRGADGTSCRCRKCADRSNRAALESPPPSVVRRRAEAEARSRDRRRKREAERAARAVVPERLAVIRDGEKARRADRRDVACRVCGMPRGSDGTSQLCRRCADQNRGEDACAARRARPRSGRPGGAPGTASPGGRRAPPTRAVRPVRRSVGPGDVRAVPPPHVGELAGVGCGVPPDARPEPEGGRADRPQGRGVVRRLRRREGRRRYQAPLPSLSGQR